MMLPAEAQASLHASGVHDRRMQDENDLNIGWHEIVATDWALFVLAWRGGNSQ